MGIKVLLDPEQRKEYLDMILKMEGLSHIVEDPLAAYCPIALTSTPDEARPILARRQEILKSRVLGAAGIKAHDPGIGPFSPDTDLSAMPTQIYPRNSGKIAGARFFVGHNLLPSDGKGTETEMAKTLNRISVMLMDRAIRASRMQQHRTIYLAYDNFDEQAEQFVPVFDMLQQFEPGIGFNDDVPVLLGFRDSKPVDLEEAVYNEFPKLRYRYEEKVPVVRLRVENPDIFYENSK